MSAALAFDIGATKLAAARVEADGSVSAWATGPTRVDDGPERILERLFALGDGVAEGAAAVGISCGGPLDPREGVLLGPLHLPGWDHVPIVQRVRDRYGLPALLVNDGSAGAWGEYSTGAARSAGSALYLTISSGMGGGAVVDGRLLAGASGNGGEFGHVVVVPGGRQCTCGRLGCAEAYVAGTQMAARAREAIAAGEPTSLADLGDPTAADIARLRDVDDVAGRIWRDGVDALAVAVVDLVNVLEPAVVVLGGGLTEAGDALLGPVRQRVAAEAMPRIRAIARVVPAELGARNCAIGAGLLAIEAHAG